MRTIDADGLKKQIMSPETWSTMGVKRHMCKIIDNAPTVEDLICAKDFKKRINNMEYVYLQECAADVIDAIDCEVTYFKEKMNHGKK